MLDRPQQQGMAAPWKAGDDTMARNVGGDPGDRARRFRDAALPYLEEGGAFIAVGALHLAGDSGLVELIRGAGYTVSAVD